MGLLNRLLTIFRSKKKIERTFILPVDVYTDAITGGMPPCCMPKTLDNQPSPIQGTRVYPLDALRKQQELEKRYMDHLKQGFTPDCEVPSFTKETELAAVQAGYYELYGSRVLVDHWIEELAEMLVEAHEDLDARGFPRGDRVRKIYVYPPDKPDLYVDLTVIISTPEGQSYNNKSRMSLPSHRYSTEGTGNYPDICRNKESLRQLELEFKKALHLDREKQLRELLELLKKGQLYTKGPSGRFCSVKLTPPEGPVRGIMAEKDWDLQEADLPVLDCLREAEKAAVR